MHYAGFMSELVPYESDLQHQVIDTWLRLQSVWDDPPQAEADIIEVDFAALHRIVPLSDPPKMEMLPATPEALYERMRNLLDSLVESPVQVVGNFLLDPIKSNGHRTGVRNVMEFYGQIISLGYSIRGPMLAPHVEYSTGRLLYHADLADPGLQVRLV